MDNNIITFSWLTPFLVAVIGALFLALVNTIRISIETAIKSVVESVGSLEKRFVEHTKKIEEFIDKSQAEHNELDKRIAILEVKK